MSYPPNTQYYQVPGVPPPGSPYNQGAPPPGSSYNQGAPPHGSPYNQGFLPPGPQYDQGAPLLGPPHNQGVPPSGSPYHQGGAPPPGQGIPGQPILEQPMAVSNVQQPMVVQTNCPPGLEYLSTVDQLMVKQTVEILEVMIGFETANKYVVKNSIGQDIYSAKEITDCCTRQCCGPQRPFDMTITDNLNREVIHINRPLKCQSCCFPCCLQTMEVSSPPGTVVGTIEQKWTCLKPLFSVKDQDGNMVLQIEGPFCTYSCFGDVVFKVLTADGSQVGQISKQWTGILKEGFTDADNFGISFPMDLDVKVKATLLGAVFLIDFMFFETSAQDEGGLLTD